MSRTIRITTPKAPKTAPEETPPIAVAVVVVVVVVVIEVNILLFLYAEEAYKLSGFRLRKKYIFRSKIILITAYILCRSPAFFASTDWIDETVSVLSALDSCRRNKEKDTFNLSRCAM